MNPTKVAISSIAVMAAFATLALAQQNGSLAERFKQYNKNGDGKVSAEEFPGPLFKQMDKDGDGFVTLVAVMADPCMDGSHDCHEKPEMTLLGGVFLHAQEPYNPQSVRCA